MSTYYVDFNSSNPQYNGLSKDSPVSDYRSLSLSAGDTVLFRCGSFIRDKLYTVENVTYGAYGEGDMPTFCGSTNVGNLCDWTEISKNIWKCTKSVPGAVGNIVFNKNECTATFRWELEDLKSQGDFFDSRCSLGDNSKSNLLETDFYLYSVGNPAEYYSDIEAVSYNKRSLLDLRDGITVENLRFINSGVHGMAGSGDNIHVKNCTFENIGGCAWNKELRIRFGNAFEIWAYGNDILVEDCSFKNVYDSCITHQGPGEHTTPARNFVCRRCVFDTYGMAAFEYRDKMMIDSSFEDNICLNAGCGFAMLGEELPRRSEIWPQPMGHHIFLWRIPEKTENGSLLIKNNTFGPAPVGAAIYSIISKEAEAQITLQDNIYTLNSTLLVRWGEVDYCDLNEFKQNTGAESTGRYSG
ncbi:MAG: hypothetical protein E7312_08500 [Clostridiales bacterium]|nr:hypothetical protein [Clostridiales bacterium]